MAETAAPPDADGLRGLADRVARHRQPVRAVIESMNPARFVHDTLEELGWEVLVADAQKLKGLTPLACKTDKIEQRAVRALPFRPRKDRTALRTDADLGGAAWEDRLSDR